MIHRVQSLIAIAFISLLLMTLPAQAINLELGQKVFEVQCIGCHENGGNIIRRGKTLKQAALKRNGYDSLETVVDIVTNGKSNMSAYRDRISAEEIQAVSGFVLSRANADWK
jgi:cytochrome c6